MKRQEFLLLIPVVIIAFLAASYALGAFLCGIAQSFNRGWHLIERLYQ